MAQGVVDSVAPTPTVTAGVFQAHARALASNAAQNLVDVVCDGSQVALLDRDAVIAADVEVGETTNFVDYGRKHAQRCSVLHNTQGRGVSSFGR